MIAAVGTDPATGRAIIALNTAAAGALLLVFDDLDPYDDFGQPDGVADRMRAVAAAIAAPLRTLPTV